MAAPFIALDWGTSRLRLALISADGDILDQRDSEFGILNVEEGGFPQRFGIETEAWRRQYPDIDTAIAGGMVGSRQGWREAPYVPLPAGLDDLAQKCMAVPDTRPSVMIVPGIVTAGRPVPDVMRGEEVQIFGVLAAENNDNGLFVLPGTHSKWALVQAGRIIWFATFMTGELFAILRRHSILGRTMQAAGFDEDAFQQGVCHGHDGYADSAGLLQRLFGVRTMTLFAKLEATQAADYLSGLLIGQEIAEAGAVLQGLGGPAKVAIVGNETLTARYETALKLCGMDSKRAIANSAFHGLYHIYRQRNGS